MWRWDVGQAYWDVCLMGIKVTVFWSYVRLPSLVWHSVRYGLSVSLRPKSNFILSVHYFWAKNSDSIVLYQRTGSSNALLVYTTVASNTILHQRQPGLTIRKDATAANIVIFPTGFYTLYQVTYRHWEIYAFQTGCCFNEGNGDVITRMSVLAYCSLSSPHYPLDAFAFIV